MIECPLCNGMGSVKIDDYPLGTRIDICPVCVNKGSIRVIDIDVLSGILK